MPVLHHHLPVCRPAVGDLLGPLQGTGVERQFGTPRRQVVVDEDRCTILPFPVVRLQFRACAVDVVAQALALEPHDDGACPWAAVLVGATSETMASLQVVYLQRWSSISSGGVMKLGTFRPKIVAEPDLGRNVPLPL